MGCGIPLRESQAADLAELAIVNGRNQAVPAAFDVRTTWDDGSIQWLWTDFYGPVSDEYFLEIHGPKRIRPTGVSVRDNGGRIIASNGVLEIVWDRRYASPVSLDGMVGGRRNLFKVEKGDGVYLVDQHEQRAVLGGDGAELAWNIETNNHARAVIRVEGFYVNAAGERIARAVMRYHLYWNRPWFKAEHRFIVTRDNDEISYKDIGVSFPLTARPSVTASLAKKDEAFLARIGGDDEAYIYQKRFPIYSRPDEYACPIVLSGKEIEDCREAGGWAQIDNGEACLAVTMKDFAQQFPKELLVKPDGITLKLWSGRDGKVLDYRPSTMARDWWQDWLPRLPYSSIPEKWFEARGITVENVLNGTFNPSCVGVARIHAFHVGYFTGSGRSGSAARWAEAAQSPPVAYADPKWTTRVGPRVLPPMSYKGEGGSEHETLERYISGWLDKFLQPLQLFPMTGWYEWGKLSEQRYEKLPDGTIYSQFHRVELFNNYVFAKHMLYAWIRSGDRKYLDLAERMIDLMSNYRVVQWPGGKDDKLRGYAPYGGGHFPVYWTGKGNCTYFRTDDFFGAGCLGYYLRDMRFIRDDLELRAEVLARDYKPLPKYVRSYPVRHMVIWVELYRLTRNPAFKQFATRLFDLHTDLKQSYAIDNGYYTSYNAASYDEPTNKLSRKVMWYAMYADLREDDKARRAAIKSLQDGIRDMGLFYGSGPDGYKNYLGYVAARIYDWTRDPEMLKHAEWQLEWLAKTWQAFEALPEDERGQAGTVRRILRPSARAGSPVAYRFEQLAIPEKTYGGNPAMLSFGNWNNGVPFLAVPAGIWALCGASYDYPERQTP